MTNPIKDIVKFNKEAGLLDAGYNHLREPAFLIEEALEGLADLPYLVTRLHSEGEFDESLNNPKEISRQIIRLATMDNKTPPSDLDIFDKHIDAFVYTVGSMAKLGLSPQQIEAGIHAVMQSNFKKVGSKKDSEGKQLKPDNWLEIEAEQNAKLQAILDKRQK